VVRLASRGGDKKEFFRAWQENLEFFLREFSQPGAGRGKERGAACGTGHEKGQATSPARPHAIEGSLTKISAMVKFYPSSSSRRLQWRIFCGFFHANLDFSYLILRKLRQKPLKNQRLRKNLKKNQIGACVEGENRENPRPTSRPALGTRASRRASFHHLLSGAAPENRLLRRISRPAECPLMADI
jgi:hypothetical protein